eukprot:TRINITY_DN133_c0_g1_i1.p2 TRINITY_DN133_c0_g1~~TRINITY_DN133_c0_g1_i1.p2  ORF type:complete len:103 (+),score=8.35 TRINITY_DN133_c0_g1_i1:181-489(+)
MFACITFSSIVKSLPKALFGSLELGLPALCLGVLRTTYHDFLCLRTSQSIGISCFPLLGDFTVKRHIMFSSVWGLHCQKAYLVFLCLGTSLSKGITFTHMNS